MEGQYLETVLIFFHKVQFFFNISIDNMFRKHIDEFKIISEIIIRIFFVKKIKGFYFPDSVDIR